MFRLLAILCLALAPMTGTAQTYPLIVDQIVGGYDFKCARFEGGKMRIGRGAIQQGDLTDDGRRDWIIDSSRLVCSTDESIFCGPEGCEMSFVVGDTVIMRVAKSWAAAIYSGQPVVLLEMHGSHCGGTSHSPCIEAMIWDKERQKFSSAVQQSQ